MSAGTRIVGIVGAGSMGIHHFRCLQRLGHDALVLARSGSDRLPPELVVRELDELLRRCTIIDICTPTESHLPIAQAALAAGADVIVEKPLARTSTEADELVRLARSSGRRVLPAHVSRYESALVGLRSRIGAGEVGSLERLHLTREVAAPTPSRWFHDDDRSGGPMLDLMIHDIDVARWIAGEVVEVRTARDARNDDGRRASAELVHASGAVSVLEAAWLADRNAAARVQQVATGNRGTIRTHVDLGGSGASEAMLQEFVDAIADGAPTRVTAEDGAAAVRLAEQAATIAAA